MPSILVLATHKYRWKEPESLDKICKLSGDSLDESGVGSGSAKPDAPREMMMIEYSDGQTIGDRKVQLESCSQSFQSEVTRGAVTRLVKITTALYMSVTSELIGFR